MATTRDLKLLVDDNGKKIICHVKDVTSVPALREKIAQKLGRRRINSIEYFDKDFEEWAHVSTLDDFPDKAKVRISKVAKSPDTASKNISSLMNDGDGDTDDAFGASTPLPPTPPPIIPPKLTLNRKGTVEASAKNPKHQLFFHSLDEDDIDTALALIREGSVVNAVHEDGDTALIWATIMGLEKVVQAILDADPTSIDQTSPNGNTALMWAIQMNHDNLVRLLHKRGAKKDSINSNGLNAIELAQSRNRKDFARALSAPVNFTSEVSGI
eukprot:g1615.t1